MARVKGRDVLLDLMDSMAELRTTLARQGEQLERVARLAQGTSSRVEGLVAHVEALAQDLTALAQAVRDTAATNLAIQRNLGRSAKLIGELAGSTRTRFDALEQRVEKLEQKAS